MHLLAAFVQATGENLDVVMALRESRAGRKERLKAAAEEEAEQGAPPAIYLTIRAQ